MFVFRYPLQIALQFWISILHKKLLFSYPENLCCDNWNYLFQQSFKTEGSRLNSYSCITEIYKQNLDFLVLSKCRTNMCFHADMVIPIPRVHLIKLRSHFHILNITFEHKIFGILNANFGVSTPILAILASLLGFLNSNFFSWNWKPYQLGVRMKRRKSAIVVII